MRLDSDAEDELLEQYLNAATAYLKGSDDYYQANCAENAEYAAKADVLTLIIASELYQNRENSVHDMSYTIRSLIAQLQYFAAD